MTIKELKEWINEIPEGYNNMEIELYVATDCGAMYGKVYHIDGYDLNIGGVYSIDFDLREKFNA